MTNINPDIAILFISIPVFLYYAGISLFKRFHSPGNILFALFNLVFAANNSFIAYLMIFSEIRDLPAPGKYSFSLIIALHIIYFILLLQYPAWEKGMPKILYFLFPAPGILAIALVLFSDTVISGTVFSSTMVNGYGQYLPIFLGIYALYFLSIIAAAHIKSRQMDSFSFKSRVLPVIVTSCTGMAVFIAAYVILPAFYNINEYSIAGLVVFGLILAFVMNYALSGVLIADFKKSFLRMFLRLLIIFIIIIPVYLFFTKIISSQSNSSSMSLLIYTGFFSMICVILCGILTGLSVKIINIKNKKLADAFRKIAGIIFDLSDIKRQKTDWEYLFSSCIDEMCVLLYIKKAAFFKLNEESGVYELVHPYNESGSIGDLHGNDIIANALDHYKKVIDKSFVYSDKKLAGYRNLMDFFNEKEYNTAMPVFSDKKLTGILLLGSAATGWNRQDFVLLLEDYRIRLSALFEKVNISEKIRRVQAVKRDRMVVKNIKKHITPGIIKGMDGFKVSSLYINNSDFGGDYFNSVNINTDKLGLFMANMSDNGIESVMLSLQINSVFQSQADMHTSPESLLNIMNQVLCSSKFTEKYAASLYMIYDNSSREMSFSNAAYNPLTIFDPKKDSFIDFDSEGVPVGIDISFRYKHRVLTVPHNGIGVCCSPGLQGLLDREGNSYPGKNIRDIIKINKDDEPSVLIKKIYRNFTEFSGRKSINDITVLVFRAE